MNSRILLLGCVLALAAALTGCTTEPETTPVTPPTETAQAAVTITLDESHTTAFGEDSGKAEYEVTLKKVIDGYRYPEGAPGGTVSPAARMKLVVANVMVSNLGDHAANLAMNDFSLITEGYRSSPTWLLAGHDLSEFPSLLTLEAGESATHDLVFEVGVGVSLANASLDYREIVFPEGSTMSFRLTTP